jgi:O-antigen/teichoic acid export membrane protein
MATQVGTLAKHTSVYGAGTIVGGIARAVLVPIIARFVPADEYGKASVVLILITLLSIVSELGLSSSLIKFVNEARSEDERKRIVSTVLLGSLFVALPIAAVAGLSVGRLSKVLLGSPQYGSLILLGVAGGLGNAVLQIGLSFERAFARSSRYFLYTLAKGVLSLAVSIILVVALKQGARGLLVGAALPPLLVGAVIYARLLGGGRAVFSRTTFRSLFDFGGPLVPMNLFMWVLASSDIYLLRRLATGAHALSEVGLYQYAHEVCLVLVLPITALNLAWPQFLFSNYLKPEGRELFARVQVYFSFFLLETAFLMSIFSKQVIGLVGSTAYAGSAGVVPMLAGSLAFYGLSVIFASGLYAAGKTRLLALGVGLSAVVNVLLNVLLIPRFGKQGAAFAALVTNLIMMTAVLHLAQARFRIPFKVGRTLAGVVLAAAVIGGLGGLSLRFPALGGVAPRLLVSCGFSMVLFAVLGLKRQDARRAVTTLISIVRPGSSAESRV